MKRRIIAGLLMSLFLFVGQSYLFAQDEEAAPKSQMFIVYELTVPPADMPAMVEAWGESREDLYAETENSDEFKKEMAEVNKDMIQHIDHYETIIDWFRKDLSYTPEVEVAKK